MIGPLGGALLAIAFCAFDRAAAETIETPQQVWDGFDPRQEPLDIQILSESNEEGVGYKEFYFTAETYDGQPVRVYTLYAAPVGGKRLPAVMHLHGGGQTASPHWLKFWTARGYAALTFDYCGKWPNRDKYTDYGKLAHGGMGGRHEMTETVEPNVRASKWYHWTLIGRRALTVLERMPEVDPDRLGIFGVSVGGSLVWYLAGSDDRVKATCAIYGCGWNTHPKSVYADDPKKDDPATVLWRKTMEPEAYAPLITQPLLFLDGTNDHHGKMDWAYRTLGSMKAPWHAAFSPYYGHHIRDEQGRDLPLFMDRCLRAGPAWPKTPKIAVALDESGVPRASLEPDVSQPIARVDIYYAVRNENPITRFWRLAQSTRGGERWTAPLPILDPRDRLFAFANVLYESGVSLSSNMQAVAPAELGSATATDQTSTLIGDFRNGFDGFSTSSPGTDPNRSFTVMETAPGPDGIAGLHMLGRAVLRTQKLGDPKWRAPAGAKLAFLIETPRAVEFDVVLVDDESRPGAKDYSHRVKLEKKSGWQEVSLEPADFKNDKEQALDAWRPFESLEFGSKRSERTDGITLANIRWIAP